jgi:hypothetical protein
VGMRLEGLQGLQGGHGGLRWVVEKEVGDGGKPVSRLGVNVPGRRVWT